MFNWTLRGCWLSLPSRPLSSITSEKLAVRRYNEDDDVGERTSIVPAAFLVCVFFPLEIVM